MHYQLSIYLICIYLTRILSEDVQYIGRHAYIPYFQYRQPVFVSEKYCRRLFHCLSFNKKKKLNPAKLIILRL